MHELWAHESTYKMLPADKAASIIVNGIEADKLYVYTGTDSGTTNLLYRLAPKFATRLIARQMKLLLG